MRDSWLKPDGELIEVGDFMHNKYAQELLEKEMTEEDFEELMLSNKSAYEVLHERGWVRVKFNTSYLPRIVIVGNCIDLTKPMRNTMDPVMNERQLKVAKELCEKCNTSLHMAINDKRFW